MSRHMSTCRILLCELAKVNGYIGMTIILLLARYWVALTHMTEENEMKFILLIHLMEMFVVKCYTMLNLLLT